jgi:hypothetical protein
MYQLSSYSATYRVVKDKTSAYATGLSHANQLEAALD